jgi:hypothetical protein
MEPGVAGRGTLVIGANIFVASCEMNASLSGSRRGAEKKTAEAQRGRVQERGSIKSISSESRFAAKSLCGLCFLCASA